METEPTYSELTSTVPLSHMKELEDLTEQLHAISRRRQKVTKQLNEFLGSRKSHRSSTFARKSVNKVPSKPVGVAIQGTPGSLLGSDIPKEDIPSLTQGGAGMVDSHSGGQTLISKKLVDEQSNVKKANAELGLINCTVTLSDETLSDQMSPLIMALRKLQQRHGQRRGVKMWTANLANLFFISDSDGSGYIEAEEYCEMVNKLDISETLKCSLRDKFREIYPDGSGGIRIDEFLMFFLNFPEFNKEILDHYRNNAPYIYERGLPCMKQWRQWIYCVVEYPEYNTVSKLLFCTDFLLTLFPIIILFVEGVRESADFDWFLTPYMWVISIIFAVEYFCGLVTCKYIKLYIFEFYHIFELTSFIFWFFYKWVKDPGNLHPMAFVVFRMIRFLKIHTVFDNKLLREDINIYTGTLQLAYRSSTTIMGFLVFTILFFSLLICVFERGEFQDDYSWWQRSADEGESPFADIYTCMYFTVVTMTTLGYGDAYPYSCVGKFVAVLAVIVGLCFFTFLINIVGDCFEDVFREFALKRSCEIEMEHSTYLNKCIDTMTKRFEAKQKLKDSWSKLSGLTIYRVHQK